MNYAAYGLGQGFANNSNNNNLINAMNTASLIQYRRDQQRLQNRYADIAQQNADLAVEKWDMEKQSLQQSLDEQKLKFEQYQKQSEGKEFVQILYGGLLSGDMRVVNSKMQSLQYVKQLADAANVISFDPISSYSDKSLQALGYSSDMNPKEYLVANLADGTKELINAQALSAKLGMGNYYTQEQLQQVFGNTTLKNLQEVSKLPLNEEGEQQATTIANIQNSAERIVDNKVDTEGKSVVRPSQFEMKNNLTDNIQKILTSLPDIQDKQQFDSFALEVMNKGSDEQKLTAAQTVINRELSNGTPLNKVSDSQIGKQSLNVLYSALSKTDQKQYDELMKQMRDNAKISSSLDYLSTPGKLDKFIEDTTLASADTWFSRAFNKVNPTIKQTVKGFDNDVVRQKYQNVLNTMIKITSGSAVSNQEAERLRMELGDIASAAGVDAIIGLKTLTENLISELKVFTNSPTLKIFVQPQLQQFESMLNGFNEIESKFGLSSSKQTTPTKTVKTNRDDIKRQVFDMIPSAK